MNVLIFNPLEPWVCVSECSSAWGWGVWVRVTDWLIHAASTGKAIFMANSVFAVLLSGWLNYDDEMVWRKPASATQYLTPFIRPGRAERLLQDSLHYCALKYLFNRYYFICKIPWAGQHIPWLVTSSLWCRRYEEKWGLGGWVYLTWISPF